MAKDPSKTEKPTPKRIKKARSEGNVMTSQDVNSMLMILIGTLLMLLLLPTLYNSFQEVFHWLCSMDCRENWSEQDIKAGGSGSMTYLGKVLAPFMLLMFVAGAIAMRLQVGKYFSTKPLKWKFEFNPKQGLTSLIPNKQNMIKMGLTLCKVLLIGSMVYFSMKNDLDALKQLGTLPLFQAVSWVLWHSFFMVIKILLLFTSVAAADYIIKRKKYFDDLMMSKQEVKDERRNAEGDPMIKSKIRQRMREIMRSQMMRNVPKADVVITNPTHVAVALQYEIGSPAPIVLAKGLRLRAEHIKELARAHNIPIVEAPPLARSLYRNVKVNSYISEEFFSAVAAILARLHRSGRRKFRHAAKPGAKTA